MNTGWNFRREHLRLHQRSHYIISNGGNQPNVVPSEAAVWYYFRELDYDRIKALHEIGQRMAQGAALMTDTEVTERVFGSAWPSNMSKPLAELMHENILEVGQPEWSEDDQNMARAVQEMMGNEQVRGLPTAPNVLLTESSQGMGGGSDDIAEGLLERAYRAAPLPREHPRRHRPPLVRPVSPWRRRSPTREPTTGRA